MIIYIAPNPTKRNRIMLAGSIIIAKPEIICLTNPRRIEAIKMTIRTDMKNHMMTGTAKGLIAFHIS